jgi:hypothetical protein
MNEEEQEKIMLANISDIYTKPRFEWSDWQIRGDLYDLYHKASPELQAELRTFWSVQYDVYTNLFGHKPLPEEEVCECGKLVKDCPDSYEHITQGC